MTTLLCWLGFHNWVGIYSSNRTGPHSAFRRMIGKFCVRCEKEVR